MLKVSDQILFYIMLISFNLYCKKVDLNWQLNRENKTVIVSVNENDLHDFLEIYKNRPLKTNTGGMGIIAMFWVWFATKHIAPDLIVESGVWKGQSTWLLEHAAPNARIVSIDPSLHFREYISPQVEYVSQDFSTLDFGDISTLNTLCFFDDHQNAYERVKQAKKKGFKHLLFDDNYPITMGGHYTLSYCLSESSSRTQYLLSLINDLVIFPHLSSNYIIDNQGKSHPVDQLNIAYKTDLNHYWLKSEQNRYRWTTYVAL